MDIVNIEQIRLFKFLLSKLSIEELNKRIEYFRTAINIRDLAEGVIKDELRKVFTINIDHNDHSFFLMLIF